MFSTVKKLEANGDLTGAAETCITILKNDPSCREALFRLGSIYSRTNIHDRAALCFEKAVKIQRDYVSFFNLGTAHYRAGSYKKAVISFERARLVDRSSGMAPLVIGLCYSRMNNIKAAEKNFREVLEVQPDNRAALTALSIIYYNRQQYAEALSLLNRLIKAHTVNSHIKEIRSAALIKSGRFTASADEIKSLSKKTEGYLYYNEFIKSVPVDILTDKYGTIDEKISTLQNRESTGSNLISLSLCHLFKGETETAIDCLYRARKET